MIFSLWKGRKKAQADFIVQVTQALKARDSSRTSSYIRAWTNDIRFWFDVEYSVNETADQIEQSMAAFEKNSAYLNQHYKDTPYAS